MHAESHFAVLQETQDRRLVDAATPADSSHYVTQIKQDPDRQRDGSNRPDERRDAARRQME